MKIRSKSLDLSQINYEEQVKADLAGNRELSAFLLIHGFIEAYLREWLYYSGTGNKIDYTQKVVKQIDRINFRNLALVHLAIGNINEKEYSNLTHINRMRNQVAHNLVKIDYQEEEFRKELQGLVNEGLSTCQRIESGYKLSLDRRAKQLAQDT